jgi:hypothetical protein
MRIYFHEKPRRLHHLLIILLFVGSCVVAAGPTARALLFTFSGADAVGEITHIEWRRINHRRGAPFHHFTYKTEAGELRAGQTRHSSIFVSAREGDRTPIRYRGDDADIASINHLWGFPAIALSVAGALLYVIIKWCREHIGLTIRRPLTATPELFR